MTWSPGPTPPDETPRHEPEIIPPSRTGGRPDPWADARRGTWDGATWRGIGKVHILRIGPLWGAVFALAALLMVVCVVLLVVGAIVISLPIAAVLLVASLLAAFFRQSRR